MSTIEHYDWRNLTYSKALEFSRLWTDACSEDPIMGAYWPAEAQFAASSLPPISEYERLIARAEYFKRLTEADARDTHLRVRSEPRRRMFLLKDPQGKYVAGAQWLLPKYLPQPRPSLYQRLKTWFLKRWYALKNWWSMRGYTNPIENPALLADLDRARQELGLEDTPERMEELTSLNPKQLKETTYPRDLTYFLSRLVTRRSERKKGYGAQIFKESLHALRPFKRPPHFVGPPKAALLSSPSARGFYQSMGFLLGAVVEHELPNGEWAPHSHYFLNLRDKV